jgi:hypothetical protein
LLRLDLRDSNGNVTSVASWLTERLIESAEANLFPKRAIAFDDLQGIFHKKYKRWAEGEYRALYERDKQEFKIRFGDYIVELRKTNPHEYLLNLLWHGEKARLLMPCLVFDNTDHFPQPFQDAVFQFAQSLHRKVFSFVICPITDRTIWQLSKGSYETKAFYLPTPSTREVLQKRIGFLREKVALAPDSRDSYFLKKGIRLGVKDIQAFAACIEDAFINTEYFSRTISWLCNHDIRRSLQLSQRVLLSPHVVIDDLVKTFLSSTRMRIPEWNLRRALFLGDYNGFNQEDSTFVLNLFDVFSDSIGTPFARSSVLQVLKDKIADAREPDDGYLEVGDVMAYLEPAGMPMHVSRRHCQVLVEKRLIEPYDPSTLQLTDATRVKITPSGLIHLEFVLSDDTYMEHLSLATPIRAGRDYDQMKEVFNKGRGALSRSDWEMLARSFAKYLMTQDDLFSKIPPQYAGQTMFRQQFRARWVKESSK